MARLSPDENSFTKPSISEPRPVVAGAAGAGRGCTTTMGAGAGVAVTGCAGKPAAAAAGGYRDAVRSVSVRGPAAVAAGGCGASPAAGGPADKGTASAVGRGDTACGGEV
jgi:hypothetical protein